MFDDFLEALKDNPFEETPVEQIIVQPETPSTQVAYVDENKNPIGTELNDSYSKKEIKAGDVEEFKIIKWGNPSKYKSYELKIIE